MVSRQGTLGRKTSESLAQNKHEMPAPRPRLAHSSTSPSFSCWYKSTNSPSARISQQNRVHSASIFITRGVVLEGSAPHATMAKTKVPKNLEVDGTAKLAAKAKPSDKHEKPDLNIEEATVASPRPSRKRAGDYFDFDGEDSGAEPSSKPAETTAKKPKRKAKTTATKEDEEARKAHATATEKGKKGAKPKAAKADAATKEKPVKEKKPKTSKAAKDGAARKEKTAEKSKAAPAEDASEGESSTVAPDLAMDDGPYEKLESEKSKTPKASKEDSAAATKAPKDTQKAAKEPKVSKTKPATETAAEVAEEVKNEAKAGAGKAKKATKSKASITETAASVADAVKKEAKAGAEKMKKVAKAKAPSTEAITESADGAKEAMKAGAGKAQNAAETKVPASEASAETAEAAIETVKAAAAKTKKAAKENAPSSETIAEIADAAKEQVKAGAAKMKKAAKANAPATETVTDNAEAAKKQVKAGAEKVKKAAKGRTPTTKAATDTAETVKKGAKAGAEKVKKATQSKDFDKPEASNPKKRKASSSGQAETVKADILDPLSEHAEESAKKKQKKQKSKSIGGAVGELLAEGANVLGGLATSFLGGAAQAADDTKESAKSSGKKAKGNGKAIAGDAAESSSKAAAPEIPADIDEDEDESDAEPDDHTAAILAGLESDGDDATASGPGFQEGQTVPEIPEAKKMAKKLKGAKADGNEGPGVVYVGRIPHGFYEHEMRQYFSQFGEINRLRLSRNKKTGASRHWAFVEFKSGGVAKIVAETMNNYLLFEHILKCAVVPQEQLHEDVWKGAGKRFQKVPWNDLEKRKHEIAVGKPQWDARLDNETKRRESKKEKMKEIGYEFEAPKLKGTEDVAKKIKDTETVEEEKSLVTAGGEEGQSLVVSEEVKTKKSKKTGKGEEITTTVIKKTKRALDADEEVAGSATKKAKKATKGTD
jgi:nucleolar protein 15